MENIFYKHYDTFSETEKGICDYIMKHSENVLSLTLLEFAKESLSSKSSVIRFCQKLGFTGYSEMRNYVKWQLKSIEKEHFPYCFLDQITNDATYFLNTLETTHWLPIFEKIQSAKNIYILTTGLTQQNQALELQRLLMLSGKNTGILSANQYSSEFIHVTETIDTPDLIIILSLSGENNQLENVVKQLKLLKITLLSITNYSNNWLSRNCTFNLYAPSSKSPFPDDWWLRTTSTFFLLIESFIFSYNDYLKSLPVVEKKENRYKRNDL